MYYKKKKSILILPFVTFSHNNMISLPPATEAAASLNLQITKSDIASIKHYNKY